MSDHHESNANRTASEDAASHRKAETLKRRDQLLKEKSALGAFSFVKKAMIDQHLAIVNQQLE